MPGGGDLTSLFIKRPDGATRRFPVASGGDSNRIMGGNMTEEVEANGDGSVRDIITARPGEREVVLDVKDLQLDHEWLVEASRQDFSTVSYTSIRGTVYTHKAKPTGDMPRSEKNGTVTVTFKGTEMKQDV